MNCFPDFCTKTIGMITKSKLISTSFLLYLLIGVTIKDTVSQVPDRVKTMLFGDTTRLNRPFAKDPHVIWFKGRYLMYYSVPGYTDVDNVEHGWGIGIAESADLKQWGKITDMNADPAAIYEARGLAAPCALVARDTVHIFYQTYGNGRKDAICHAWSVDGLHFTRNMTNPVFSPSGKWNCGRAIDAEVIPFNGRYYLYYATRDPDFKIQILGVAAAPGNTNFGREAWTNISEDGPILKPELQWERDCIEAASVIRIKNELFMFYAGGYNNAPQQIGVAKSPDGIHWTRLAGKPFLANGNPGDWNSSESGHPHIFNNPDGSTWLFYQGNKDNGRTWYISNKEVIWKDNSPLLVDSIE